MQMVDNFGFNPHVTGETGITILLYFLMVHHLKIQLKYIDVYDKFVFFSPQ